MTERQYRCHRGLVHVQKVPGDYTWCEEALGGLYLFPDLTRAPDESVTCLTCAALGPDKE